MSAARLVARIAHALACALVAVVLLPGHAAGQTASAPDPRAAMPERPSVATHAFSVAPGFVELEAGFQRQPVGPDGSDTAVPAVLKIGLGERVQLGVGFGWQRLSESGASTSAVTDTSVSVKWRIVDASPWLGACALQGTVWLPTGSEERGTGSGSAAVGVLAIASRAIGPVALDVNAGYTFSGGDGEVTPEHSTMWAVAAGFPLAGDVGWVAEFFGYPATGGPSGSPSSVGFLTGPSLTVSPSVVLDAGVIVSVDGLGDTAVYAGLTWNMGRAWGREPASASRRRTAAPSR